MTCRNRCRKSDLAQVALIVPTDGGIYGPFNSWSLVMPVRPIWLALATTTLASVGAFIAGDVIGAAQDHMNHAQHAAYPQNAVGPTMAGQDAFGAIQEIVRILESDPATDWSKINIDALREHLIDMNEVTLHAVATERVLDNGIEIVVTGEGRTSDAIKRMVPAHVAELVKLGWNAKTEDLPNGIKLTVITSDPKELTKLKALGFMGIMVQGGHHQIHHLMMAKGEHPA